MSFVSIFIFANIMLWLKIKSLGDEHILCPVNDRFNEITLERFAIQPEKWKIITVGSSATSMIPPLGYWPKEYYSITQLGGTATTGIEAILRSGAKPKRVFIEADFLNKDTDKEILDQTFSKANLIIKKYFPIFRKEYSPIVYFHTIIYPQINYNVKSNESNESDVWNKKKDELGNKVRKRLAIEEEKKVPDLIIKTQPDIIIKTRIKEIRNVVDKIRNNGAEVIFFTLPLHPILTNDKKYQKWNEYIKNEFKDYKWVSFAPEKFLTGDGIHPTPEAGYRMFQKLVE